jgi:hypothetical protein
MSIISFIDQLSDKGITLALDGEELKLRGNRSALTPSLLEDIKSRKTEIVSHLESLQISVDSSLETEGFESRVFELPGGKTASFSRQEFHELVEAFRVLHAWQYEK